MKATGLMNECDMTQKEALGVLARQAPFLDPTPSDMDAFIEIKGSDSNRSYMSPLTLQCVAMCLNVLKCVAVRCSVSQCVAVCYSTLQCVTVCGSVCCSVLQ